MHTGIFGRRASDRLLKPNHLEIVMHDCEAFKESFEFWTMTLWNKLPYDKLASITNCFDSFKKFIY